MKKCEYKRLNKNTEEEFKDRKKVRKYRIVKNSDICFFNGADGNGVQIDIGVSKQVIGTVWISPEYYKKKHGNSFAKGIFLIE